MDFETAVAERSAVASRGYVDADLTYLAPTILRPRNYTFDPPPGEPRSNTAPDVRRVRIEGLRGIEDSVSLDVQGFAVLRHVSAVRDFYDDEEVRSVYYPEAERAIAASTGADRVFIFDHTVRRRVAGSEDRSAGAPRQPATRVHVDHTENSGPQRVRDFFGDEAEALLRGRVQVINLWRPIRGPLLDMPLAMCDARSVRQDELVASDLVYPDRVGETYAVRFSREHRWFYLPRMQTTEALLLKCYDSETDGRARFSPHTAFADPTTPPDARPRESIELRTLVFHAR